MTASFFGIAAFIIPYAIVVRPALLGLGTLPAIAGAALSAVAVGVALAAMVRGYWLARLGLPGRGLMGAASLLMLVGGLPGFAVGAAILIVITALQLQARRAALAAPQ